MNVFRGFYGWRIVGVAFATEFTVSAIGGATISLFFIPMRESLGWSITTLTGAVAIRAAAGMISSPMIGMILDRHGPRLVITIGAAVAGIATAFLVGVQERWQLWLLFAVIGLAGMGEPGNIAPTVTLAKWFVRMRGRAMAISTQGQLLGGVCMTPIVAFLLVEIGWRSTWVLLGLFVLSLNVPLAAMFMRRQPEDMGLLPDGDPLEPLTGTTRGPSSLGQDQDESWSVREALHTPTFWLLVLGFNFILFATISIVYHQVLFFTGEGLSMMMASYVLMGSMFGGVLSRVFWGVLVDHFSVRICLTTMALFRAIGTLSLVIVPFPYHIAPFLVFWGFLGGAVGLLLPLSFANYYGRTFQGRIQGILRPLLGISSVVGPVSLAVLFEITGTYTLSFGVAAALAWCSVLLFAIAPVPVKGKEKA